MAGESHVVVDDLRDEGVELRSHHGGTLKVIRSPERARELAQLSHASRRQNLAAGRVDRAKQAGDVRAAVCAQLDKQAVTPEFADRSIEDAAQSIVRQMAGLLIDGVLVPTTTKEAVEVAKIWSGIAKDQRIGAAADSVMQAEAVGAISGAVQSRMLEFLAAAQARRASQSEAGSA